MKMEKRKLSDLEESKYNPRKNLQPGDIAFDKLKDSIKEFGYVEPIIVNQHSTIVGGHQRFSVRKSMGVKTVDVVVVDLGEKKEKALNVALNKIEGQWDDAKLQALVAELNSEDFNVGLTGFTLEEINEIMDSGGSQTGIEEDSGLLERKMESYLEGTVKQVILYFEVEQYKEVIARLTSIQAAEGTGSNTETFVRLLDCYEKNQPSEAQGKRKRLHP